MESVPAIAQLGRKQLERGTVYTRSEVVEFILDLSGYSIKNPLFDFNILEPSFGSGEFLLPIVDRLLTSYSKFANNTKSITARLANSIRAVEIDPISVKRTKIKLSRLFSVHGVAQNDGDSLLSQWIITGDYLLVHLSHKFTHVLGNPPYVRQELIPDSLLAEYRKRYKTIYDRADLYVPFIERSLRNLTSGGVLAFICSDRWMKNKYGALLRELVSSDYHLSYYVDMVDTQAFHTEVSAYPGIIVVSRSTSDITRVTHRPQINRKNLKKLSKALLADKIQDGANVIELRGVVRGQEPWLLQNNDQLAVMRRLEEEFPLIEDSGCRVGIGVATGADGVFIDYFDKLDVEDDRKLPLVRTGDIRGGSVKWEGYGVINPFNEKGGLVDLMFYPKLSKYLYDHEEPIRKRSCAKRNPKKWYRTIDRILPSLLSEKKLLIPDIKGEAHIVYEDGLFYPHHNLYYITSDDWDLRALQAILQAGIAKLFVAAYSTQMRGGYLRFQAQYLRRIRLPHWQSISEQLKERLIKAATNNDFEAIVGLTSKLYRFNSEEQNAVGINWD